MNILMKKIATIKSPFCDLKDMPVQPRSVKETYSTIEFTQGLKDLNRFSHVYLIYYRL